MRTCAYAHTTSPGKHTHAHAAHCSKQPPQEEWRGKVVRLSWKPRAYLFKHFLTEAECDHLVSLVGWV